MSATIAWTISYMQCKPIEGQYTNVVITAGWRCTGSQLVGEAPYQTSVTGATYGECSFSSPEGFFTPYNQLTQEQVLEWCWANGVDKTIQEAIVQNQVADQIDPPIVQPPLPWATPAA